MEMATISTKYTDLISRLISPTRIEKTTLLLITSFLFLFSWLCLFSQKIPINNGIGWDGLEYARIVKLFPHYLHAFDQYRSHRVFPSFIVALGLRAFGLANSDENIIYGFEMLNFVAVLFAVSLWWCFVVRLRINMTWRLISFSGLFLNFPILTLASYNPVLTDTVAFALGIAIFYFYYIQKPSCVFLFGLLGCFTFPLFNILTFLLVLFPYQEKKFIHTCVSSSLEKNKFNLLALGVAAGLVMIATMYLSILILPTSFLWPIILHAMPSYATFALNSFAANIVHITPNYVPSFCFLANLTNLGFPLLTASMLILFAYVYLGLKYIFTDSFLSAIKCIGKHVSFRSLAMSMALILINIGVLSLLSNDVKGALTPLSFFLVLLTEFSSLPFINLVDAFIQYGPFVFFIILFWRRICTQAYNMSLGCVLSLALFRLFSLSSEGRQYINFIGMLVFIVLIVVSDSGFKQLPMRVPLLLMGLSLLFSKFWFHITMPSIPPISGVEILSPIWQDYYMNYGPWMSPSRYLLQFIVIGFSLAILRFFLSKMSPEASTYNSGYVSHTSSREMLFE